MAYEAKKKKKKGAIFKYQSKIFGRKIVYRQKKNKYIIIVKPIPRLRI